MALFKPSPGNDQIKIVKSFSELVTTPFENSLNALCWQRNLAGDFNEIVKALGSGNGIDPITDLRLNALTLSDKGKLAREILLEDQQLLKSLDLSPSLDCIYEGARDSRGGPISTDVFSFHVDAATDIADTYLCSYTESASEGLRNDEAQRQVDIPDTRAQLLNIFGGEDNEHFEEFLESNCYDLHYRPLPHAQPFSFGLGNLWRIATQYPGSPVPPCIHRAPATLPNQLPRLLLIS